MEANLQYRELAEFPGYYIGSDGSIWTQRWREKWRDGWKRLTLSRRKTQGYITACFRIGPKNYVRYLHRLVLEAFVGPCPEGMECRHRNGNRQDNRVENLCWGTHEENTADKRLHGTHRQGEAIPSAKLREEAIPAIRSLYEDGICTEIIGRAFGISSTYVWEVARGDKWKHVEKESPH